VLKAAAVLSKHLPSVSLASLPPLTLPCGKPGASGSVFKIEYQGKDAAVKEFHKHMHDMLRRELKSLHLLAHPNVVRVLAVVINDAAQPMGFVMEYLPVPLDEAMQRMSLRQAVHALVEACVGVAVAHDAKVIHSDIKPGNVLCSDDFSVVKLADFGLAHSVTASLSSVSMARGTPLYVVRLCLLQMSRPTVDRLATGSWRLSCTMVLRCHQPPTCFRSAC
jgi:serine/threonine protein kinase